MTSKDETVIARLPNNRAREVRIIRARYPQECLNRSTKPLNMEATAASPIVPRTYQNTGVQTLPAANGDVFRLIHGREPSHNDYARSMGSAGVGRFTNGPRLNPYELVYGSAFLAPTAAREEKYTNSGFQTASHETRRRALARAKVKSSIMANKYRKAASKAGYVIFAETREEMIVHSEQVLSAVQLDTEGNLLKGDVKSRSLPNIYGALVHDEPSEATLPQEVLTKHMESLAKQPTYVEHGVQTSQSPYPSPLHSSRMPCQESTAELQRSANSVSALAPASVEHVSAPVSVVDNEYGSGEPATDEFVVYDASTEYDRLDVTCGSMKTSQGKRKASKNDALDCSPKKHKPSAQASPRSPSISLAPLAVTHPNKPDQDCSGLPLTPDSDFEAHTVPSGISSMQPEDSLQARTLNIPKAGTTLKAMSESNPSSLTDTSRVQESKSRLETSRGRYVDDKGIVAGARGSVPSEVRGHNNVSRALNKPGSARLTDGTLEPSVSLALAKTERQGLDVKATDLASQRSKRPCGKTGAKPVDVEQDTKRARRAVGGHHDGKGSARQEADPRRKRESSMEQNLAEDAHSQKQASDAATRTDRTACARVKKTSVSHTSRAARRLLTPYVPPAKRLRD